MLEVAGQEIKVVGRSGQISLGKALAGKTLRVEHHADGAILLTPVAVVPESQLWTLNEPDRSRIARGVAWAARTVPHESDVDKLEEQAARRRTKARRGRRR
jgi:hypothetical protein